MDASKNPIPPIPAKRTQVRQYILKLNIEFDGINAGKMVTTTEQRLAKCKWRGGAKKGKKWKKYKMKRGRTLEMDLTSIKERLLVIMATRTSMESLINANALLDLTQRIKQLASWRKNVLKISVVAVGYWAEMAIFIPCVVFLIGKCSQLIWRTTCILFLQSWQEVIM
jgi:hypothetical protein